MIKSLDSFDLADGLDLLYGGIAAAISAGVLLGIAVVWISVAARGTDAT